MPAERIGITLRLRLTARRAVDELAAFTGASREDTINSLILAGLPEMYARLGIRRDPAAMTSALLEAVAGQWDDIMTDEEIAAAEVTRKAMDRIAQVRIRDRG